jgi:hypothetical protein
VTAAAARALNLVPTTDPGYGALREQLVHAGELRVTGDASPLASVLDAAHDPIVQRTA